LTRDFFVGEHNAQPLLNRLLGMEPDDPIDHFGIGGEHLHRLGVIARPALKNLRKVAKFSH
jgi:hypothetical protein